MSKKEKEYSYFTNLRFIWREHWKFEKSFLFFPIIKIPVMLVSALLGLFLPKIVLDSLTENDDIRGMIFKIVLGSVLLAFFSTLVTRLDALQEIKCFKFFIVHCHTAVLKKHMEVEYEYFCSPEGKIDATKARQASSGDITIGVQSFYYTLTGFIVNLFGFSAFIVVLSTLNPWIILFLILSYCLDGIIALFAEKGRRKDSEPWAEVYRKNEYIAKKVSLTEFAKDIRIYSLNNWLKSIRELLLKEEMSLTARRERRTMLQLIFEGVLVFVRDGLAYAYLIHRMLNGGGMTIGTFVVYFAAIAGFGSWLTELVANLAMHLAANTDVNYYRKFIEWKPANNGKQKSLPPGFLSAPPSIKLAHVSYSYPNTQSAVLSDINLEIIPGENIALVGVNGAGKTTLIKLICGLMQPSSGSIYLNDIDIQTIDKSEYFQMIAALFQDSSIIPCSIGENIAFEKELNAENERRLSDIIALADIDSKINSLPSRLKTRLMKQFNSDGIEFSGGELQKMLLARALYKDAPVLILDEPTAALDPVAEEALYLKYHSLSKNKTAIYISHRLSSTRFCDRIVLLDDSQIAECGTHDELMEQGGKYAEMFHSSSKYYSETICFERA